MKFSLSLALAAYYLIYLIRLMIGCCKISKNNEPLKRNQYNSLKILTLYFDLTNIPKDKKIKEKKSSKNHQIISYSDIPIIKKLYIPFLMIRLATASTFVIYFSSNPTLQAISFLSVAGLWTLYSMIFCPY